jgi:hypothetical protein
MRAHLLHGFNVTDGGTGSIDRLAPFFTKNGIQVIDHDYGWVGLFGLRRRNQETVKRILPTIRPGDVLLAHSNGCLIAWQLVEAGAPLAAVICIQPALRRDTRWRSHVQVLCLKNDEDWIVSLGRMWGRFASVANPWRNRHGWGSAGRHGFTSGQPNVSNWDTNTGPCPATGHSGIFRPDAVLHWGPKIYRWATRTLRSMAA